MRLNTDLLVGFGGVIVGLIGIGYAMGSQKKLNDVCGILDKAIDEVVERFNDELSAINRNIIFGVI